MNIYVSAFSLCNFSDKAVEMQTMKNVTEKSPHKIFIYGPILKCFTESLTCAWSYRNWNDLPTSDTKSR